MLHDLFDTALQDEGYGNRDDTAQGEGFTRMIPGGKGLSSKVVGHT